MNKTNEINVQFCPCGHIEVSCDPEDIRLSEERVAKGFVDALTKPSTECTICQEEDEIIRRRNAQMLGLEPAL